MIDNPHNPEKTLDNFKIKGIILPDKNGCNSFQKREEFKNAQEEVAYA